VAEITRLPASGVPALDPAPVAEGILRVDAITHVPAVLRGLGLDPDATIAAVGIDPGIFADRAREIPIGTLGRLLRIASALSGCAHVGLLVGQQSGLDGQGLVGRLAGHAPDVATALHTLTAHLHLRDRGAVAPLFVADGVASFGYEIYDPEVEGADQIDDGALAIEANILRALCGRGWAPSEVLFAHRAPPDLRPYRRFFAAPLHFDAERTALLFPATWLERRISGADPVLFAELTRRVAALELQASEDLPTRLRRMLRVMLLTEKGSVEEVASRLGMHRRTLNRRLAAYGTSLHRLVEEVRSAIARQLVRNTRMPLTDIAATLGYADASAFTRAFRRWTGALPSVWRSIPPAGL
jgi:AraC-like DNA-binding protein